MFRLSLTVLLALSISAKFVLTIEVFHADTTNLQKESPVGVLKNNNQTEESPKAHEEPSRNVTRDNFTLERDQQKVDTLKEQAKNSSLTSLTNGTATSSVKSVTPKMTRPIEETTPVTDKETVTQNVGNFTGEQDNLNQCCVNPPDEDEKDVVTIEATKEKATSADGTLETTSPSIVPPKFFPVTKDVQSITNVSSDVAARLNTTMYKTFPPDSEGEMEETTLKVSTSTVVTKISTTTTITTTTRTPTSTPTPTPTPTSIVVTKISTPTSTVVTDVINATTVSKTNQTKNANGKMAVEGLENVQQAELSEKGKESNDGSKNESMPSGIIALVTAISFAVAIAIGYISMIVWKQYLEHRYGRRELLVNELEFDTNDLRHFEL